MKTATVLSVPLTGTRFYLYFLRFVLGVDAKFQHFYEKDKDALADYIRRTNDVLIVPVREHNAIKKSYSRFLHTHLPQRFDEYIAVKDYLTPLLVEHNAHFMDIEKNENTKLQFDRLLDDLQLGWTPEAESFVNKWEKIGIRGSDEKSNTVLNSMTPEWKVL